MTIDNIMTLAFGSLIILLVIAGLFAIVQAVRARLFFTKETANLQTTLLEMELLKAQAEATDAQDEADGEQSDALGGEETTASEEPPFREPGG